jgi:hypothetical protein
MRQQRRNLERKDAGERREIPRSEAALRARLG